VHGAGASCSSSAAGEQEALQHLGAHVSRRELPERQPTELEVSFVALGLVPGECHLEDVVALVVDAVAVSIAVLDDGEQALDACVAAELLRELTEKCGLDLFSQLDVATRQEPPRRSERPREQDSPASHDDGPGDDLRLGVDQINLTGAGGSGLLSHSVN
jgi:hypothetical protein